LFDLITPLAVTERAEFPPRIELIELIEFQPSLLPMAKKQGRDKCVIWPERYWFRVQRIRYEDECCEMNGAVPPKKNWGSIKVVHAMNERNKIPSE